MKKIIIVLSVALLAGLISCQKDGAKEVEDTLEHLWFNTLTP